MVRLGSNRQKWFVGRKTCWIGNRSNQRYNATCRVLVEEGLLAFPNPGEGAGRSDDPMLRRVWVCTFCFLNMELVAAEKSFNQSEVSIPTKNQYECIGVSQGFEFLSIGLRAVEMIATLWEDGPLRQKLSSSDVRGRSRSPPPKVLCGRKGGLGTGLHFWIFVVGLIFHIQVRDDGDLIVSARLWWHYRMKWRSLTTDIDQQSLEKRKWPDLAISWVGSTKISNLGNW